MRPFSWCPYLSRASGSSPPAAAPCLRIQSAEVVPEGARLRHAERSSPDLSADEHIALPERPDDGKPLPFEHANRPEPSCHRSPARRRVRFHDSASTPPYRLQRRVKGDPRYSGPSTRSIHEETGDPPARRGAESTGHGPVLASAFDPRQVFAATELTPSNRFAVSVH